MDAVLNLFDVRPSLVPDSRIDFGATQIGNAKRIDPDFAFTQNQVSVGSDEMSVHFSVDLGTPHLEVIRLRVRRNESMEISTGDSAIHNAETACLTEGCTTLQIISDRRRPRLILSTIVRGVEIGHELNGDRIMVDIDARQMLAASRSHDAGDDSVRHGESPAIGNVRRK